MVYCPMTDFSIIWRSTYGAFSHDVMVAMLVFQKMKRRPIGVSTPTPVGVEFFSYANAFFCSNKFA